MKKIVVIAAAFAFVPSAGHALYDLQDIQEKFKEKGAVVTPFSVPDNFSTVEKERLGPGWRYITYNKNILNNVIIYNHGHRGRKKSYKKFAKSKKAGPRDLYEKAKWYYSKGVNFYAALRKQTRDLSGEYGRSVEGVEVFYHLTNKVKKLHGKDVKICYVGHSEGGAPVLYTSIFLVGRHVAISPSNGKSPFTLTGKQYYESPKYYKKSKNLTILMSGLGLETNIGHNNLFKKAEELKNINTKLFKNFRHAVMASNVNIELIGSAVIAGCGF